MPYFQLWAFKTIASCQDDSVVFALGCRQPLRSLQGVQDGLLRSTHAPHLLAAKDEAHAEELRRLTELWVEAAAAQEDGDLRGANEAAVVDLVVAEDVSAGLPRKHGSSDAPGAQ